MSEQLQLPNLAARIFDQPLLIAQSKLDVILHTLGPRMGFDIEAAEAEQVNVEALNVERYEARLSSLAPPGEKVERREQGYFVVGDVAVVPIIGSLVHRSSWIDAMSGLMSYGRIESMMGAAMADWAVREIIMEIDSHGGEATGAFDAADRLAAMRGAKPITAIAAEIATSGAFLLASVADQIVVPRTGAVGSIGVVSAHFDQSKALERRGIAVTYIYAGDRKIDGSPWTPLSPEARSDFQTKIDAMYSIFVATVARNLGVDPAMIKGTQAAIYMGQQAVDAGLAHRVASFEQEFTAAVSRQAGPFRLDAQRKESEMSEQKQGNGGPAMQTAEDVARARADGVAEGRGEIPAAVQAAVTAERARIKGIMTHAEAEGRAELAAELAFGTDMSAEQATALLAKSPKAAAQSPLSAAMAREAGANVPSQPGQQPAPTVPVINSENIFAQRRAAAQAKR